METIGGGTDTGRGAGRASCVCTAHDGDGAYETVAVFVADEGEAIGVGAVGTEFLEWADSGGGAGHEAYSEGGQGGGEGFET